MSSEARIVATMKNGSATRQKIISSVLFHAGTGESVQRNTSCWEGDEWEESMEGMSREMAAVAGRNDGWIGTNLVARDAERFVLEQAAALAAAMAVPNERLLPRGAALERQTAQRSRTSSAAFCVIKPEG